jgi:hypothetical protein
MDFVDFTAVGMRFGEPRAAPGAHARRLRAADALLLRPEPQNPHDPAAVQVCDAASAEPLAHVSRETLPALPPLPPAGRLLRVYSVVDRQNALLFRCTLR